MQHLRFIGYSLGSIILLDSIFPFGNRPSKGVVNNINTIVTIGCLHSFISSFLPNYFSDRKDFDHKLKNWFNIYSKVDAISSNFRRDFKSNESEFGIIKKGILPNNVPFEIINAKSLRFIDYLMFIGIRAHKMYWGNEPDSTNCLKDLIIKQSSLEV